MCNLKKMLNKKKSIREYDPKKLENDALNNYTYITKKIIFSNCRAFDNIKDKIVMLGDSITDFCEYNEFFPGIHIFNRGIAGDTITGIKLRFKDISKLNPSKLFLLIGINNFSLCFSLEQTKVFYKEMLQEIRKQKPYMRLFLISVLPVKNNANIHIPNNDNIIALNKYIKQISSCYGAEFIDVYNDFIDNTGQMIKSYAVDGIHLNNKGYEVFCNKLKPYILE